MRIGPGAEVGVVVVGDLLDDRGDRLGLDAGLGGVVDAARQVAVGRDLDGGREQGTEHASPSVVVCRGGLRRRLATLLRVSGSDGPVPGGRNRTPRWGSRRGARRLDAARPARRATGCSSTTGGAPASGGRRGGPAARRRPLAVKRAAERRTTELGEPGWWLLSDDAAAGRGLAAPTARSPDDDVLAVVVRRIWPLARRSAVPDSTGA